MASKRDPIANHRRFGWLIIVLLLLLRIPYSIILTYGGASSIGWGPAGYELATYLLTSFLIWWEREDLAAVHMDTPAIVLIMLFKPVQTLILRYWGIDTPLSFPHPASILIWAMAIALTAVLWSRRHERSCINLVSYFWLGAGLLAGLALSAVPAIDVFRHAQDLVPSPSVSISTGLAFLYQMGFAAVSEEPLFRGFLWGYLCRLGWREKWVWITQMLLFMMAHLYFINAMHVQFWVLVPVAGLLFGLLAWRSRSIAPGMLAHAAYNAGAYIILLNALAGALRTT
jgi:hypothetical protein